MSRAFLYCEPCGEVGREPALVFGSTGLEGIEAVLEEGFARRHAGHPVQRLPIVPEAYVSEAGYGERVPLAFHEVEDARGVRHVVEARREAPGRPPVYRMRRAVLVRTRETIAVDRGAIARVVADALGRPMDAPVASAAGTLAGVVAAEADASGFGALEARAVAGAMPLLAYAPLPDRGVARLFETARRLVTEGPLAPGRVLSPRRVARLLDQHAGPGGAFAPILETGYALVGATGAVEAYIRRVRARDPLPETR